MEIISDKDFYQAAQSALRHYVPFSYYARSKEIFQANQGIAQMCVCSGFVILIRGVWYLTTAGHVLDEIDSELNNGIKQVSFRLWDGFGLHAVDTHYIPFDYQGAKKHRINERGLDYGLICLDDYYVNLLKANNIVPVADESYEKTWPLDFHAFAMIGTPGKTVSLKLHDARTTKVDLSVYIVRLAEEADPPSELVKEFSRFYARIVVPEDAPDWLAIGGDIRGMSGGPIIAIRRDAEGLKYWITAVQSGWLESKRIIAACPLQDFVRILAKRIDAQQ